MSHENMSRWQNTDTEALLEGVRQATLARNAIQQAERVLDGEAVDGKVFGTLADQIEEIYLTENNAGRILEWASKMQRDEGTAYTDVRAFIGALREFPALTPDQKEAVIGRLHDYENVANQRTSPTTRVVIRPTTERGPQYDLGF